MAPCSKTCKAGWLVDQKSLKDVSSILLAHTDTFANVRACLMQRSLEELFQRKGNQRRSAQSACYRETRKQRSTDRNQGDGPRLLLFLKTAEKTIKKTKSTPNSQDLPSARAAKMSRSIPGQRATTHKPGPTRATRAPDNVAPVHSQQKEHYESVRNFQNAARLHKMFANASNQSEAARQAWQAAHETRRAATARMYKNYCDASRDMAKNLANEKERIAKATAEKNAARKLKAAKDAAASWARLQSCPSMKNDCMWPKNEWEASFDDFSSSKESTKTPWERDEPSLNDGFPFAFSPSLNSHRDHMREESAYYRDFDGADPDDYWGHGGDDFGGARSSFRYYNNNSEQSHSCGSDNPRPWSCCGSNDCDDEESSENRNTWRSHVNADDVGSDEEDGMYDGPEFEFFTSEKFKSSWHQHSRAHHSNFYYTTGSERGRGYESYGNDPPVEGVGVSSWQAAKEAGDRALKAARTPAFTETEEKDLQSEVVKQIDAAANFSGNNIIVFAAALGVTVEGSEGSNQAARRSAWRQLIMVFHPDKLQSEGGRGLLLGEKVIQCLNSMKGR